MRARPVMGRERGGALAHRRREPAWRQAGIGFEYPSCEVPTPDEPAHRRAGSGCSTLSGARYNCRVLDERDSEEPVLPARPGSLSKDWVLKALSEAGNSLLSELYGLEEQELRWRPAEGEWSLKEIAAHLRDAEELALAQINAFVSGSSSPLPVWDVDLLPQERDYQSEEMAGLLAAFGGMRRGTTYLLWGLTEADWRRAAEHPYRGPVTLEQVARELAQHDLEHLWQVRQLKERLRQAVPAREGE